MLRGRGASGAQTLKGRLGRLRKRGGDNDGGRFPRLGRRNSDKARPPVQHAESLSSDEDTKESGSTKEASDDNNMRSPGSSTGTGVVLSPGGMATSSSGDSSERYDEGGDLESPRRWGKGIGEGGGGTTSGGTTSTNSVSTVARKTTPQTSQLRSGLFRLKRKMSRQPPATRLSAPSDSSSAPSTEEDDEERNQPGTDSSPSSRAAVGAPLLDNRQQPSSRGTRSKPHRDHTRGRQRTTTGAETAAAGSVSDGESIPRSSRTIGAPLRERRRERMFPSWPRLVSGWGRLGDTGEHEMAAVSGVGRPAAGMLENTMYSWFGGVVGRAWPGVGLALNPVVSDKDSKQVISSPASGSVTVVVRVW